MIIAAIRTGKDHEDLHRILEVRKILQEEFIIGVLDTDISEDVNNRLRSHSLEGVFLKEF